METTQSQITVSMPVSEYEALVKFKNEVLAGKIVCISRERVRDWNYGSDRFEQTIFIDPASINSELRDKIKELEDQKRDLERKVESFNKKNNEFEEKYEKLRLNVISSGWFDFKALQKSLK